jgi:phage tail tape-measure protein
MVIGGDFTSIAGTTRSRAARLTASGAVDTAWNTGPGFDGVVQSMVQLNGASYIHTAGAFSSFQNSLRNKTAVIGQSAAEPGRTPWGPSSLTVSRIWSID